MKNKKINYLKNAFLLGLVLLTSLNCERDLSEDVTDATFSKTGEIFTDLPVGMGSNFYFPYGGSKATAWSVDDEVSYKGSASMRFDIPNADDPEGNYAGAIFRIDGAGRDLTGYDALTFWAKSSQGVSIDQIGFGEDFMENKYIATITNVSVGTNWTKYIIPLPDASKLLQERGMFRYAAGTQGTGGLGYTLWIDELRFEKLGTIAQPRPAIANGVNQTIDSFIGVTIPVTGLKETFNLPSGFDQDVFPAVSYFVFRSSNPNVATVNATGQISVLNSGVAVITGNIGGTLNTDTNQFEGGVNSVDSITINSLGNFQLAPVPTRNPIDVLSVFSDAYTNVPVDYYNGFWTPGSTTGSADFVVNGDNILNYTDFNYVGTAMSNPTLDATAMTHFHLNMYIPESIPANFDFLISIEDWGPNQVDNGGDDTRQQIFVSASQVVANTWITVDVPLNLVNKNNIGLIIYENINGSSLSNFYIDNVYFYKEPTITTAPTVAAPTPTLAAANVISLFSNQYTNVPVDTWKTSWSSATFADVTIAGNATKQYSNLDFVGIETVNNQINASAMTHVHIDVWSANFTSFSLKLVDFGADGAFGGGDDTEHQLNFPAPLQGQWISYDLPLSSFTGLASKQHLAQYILVAQPTGSANVYIDNFYFHN